MLQQLKDAAAKAGIPNPHVIITDFNQALKNALTIIFNLSQQQIYT